MDEITPHRQILYADKGEAMNGTNILQLNENSIINVRKFTVVWVDNHFLNYC